MSLQPERPWEGRPGDESTNQVPGRRRPLWPWLAGGAIAVAIGASSLSGADDSEADRWEAEQQCKSFAEKRLKAPDTADFDLSASGGPLIYTVTGTVDAENSFGAKLRSNLTCRLRFEDDRVVLESLTGLD